MDLVLGSWDVILDETRLSSCIYSPTQPFFSLASLFLREISLFTIRTLILLLFRVSTNYRYPLHHFTNAFPPILVLPFILLFFFTKLFSRFLCVLVVLLLGRGWSCIGFSLRSFSGIWLAGYIFKWPCMLLVVPVSSFPRQQFYAYSHPLSILFPSFFTTPFLPVVKSLRLVTLIAFMHADRNHFSISYNDPCRILLSPSRILGYP